MTRRFAITLLVAVALATGLASSALAHDGHAHTAMGTVTMVAPDHVMLTDTDGKDATVHITKDTKIVKDKKVMTIADIKAGMRVVVSAEEEQEKMMAKTIELGVTAQTK
jgi:hypothetical protein